MSFRIIASITRMRSASASGLEAGRVGLAVIGGGDDALDHVDEALAWRPAFGEVVRGLVARVVVVLVGHVQGGDREPPDPRLVGIDPVCSVGASPMRWSRGQPRWRACSMMVTRAGHQVLCCR